MIDEDAGSCGRYLDECWLQLFLVWFYGELLINKFRPAGHSGSSSVFPAEGSAMNSKIIFVWVFFGLVACSAENEEFVLPPGDEFAGRETFIELGCNQCHRVEGGSPEDSLRVAQAVTDLKKGLVITLGGRDSVIRSYSDLVTSIINPHLHISPRYPQHEASADTVPKMPNYGDTMTVQQLVDLTTFLQARYSLWSPRYVLYQYF